jgi:hypothetical protein
MSEVSEKVTTVEVKDEFRVCPSCGYQRGFHVSFQPEGNAKSLRLVLICPNCGARYEINKFI